MAGIVIDTERGRERGREKNLVQPGEGLLEDGSRLVIEITPLASASASDLGLGQGLNLIKVSERVPGTEGVVNSFSFVEESEAWEFIRALRFEAGQRHAAALQMTLPGVERPLPVRCTDCRRVLALAQTAQQMSLSENEGEAEDEDEPPRCIGCLRKSQHQHQRQN
jgi:hypothetical protein